MRFSFDESARSEIRGFFEEALVSVGTETENLFNELVSIYTREQYQPLYNMTKSIADYYTGEFRNDIQRRFNEWLDSETSIKAFAQELRASDDTSDDAYIAAQHLETDLLNVVDELFSKPLDIPSVSTEAHLTKDVEDIFDEIDELVGKFTDEAENLVSDYDSRVDAKIDENQLYVNVSEILGAVLQAFKSLFDVFREGVANLLIHISDRGASAESKSEADKQQMRSQAETAGEALKDISGLFDFD